MEFWALVLIALSLSLDCFAVALSGSIALGRFTALQVLRLSFAFGFSQFIMPLLGWLAGQTIVNVIASFDHWVAFGLLCLAGGRMIWEAFRDENEVHGSDITRGLALLTLSIATSIDSLAVGLSFAFLEVNILGAASIIGMVAFMVTATGFLMGKKVGELFGKRAKLVGGLVLIGIGTRIILEHILG